MRPIKARKIRYFRDRLLRKRLLPPAPVPHLDLTTPGTGPPWGGLPRNQRAATTSNADSLEPNHDRSGERVALKEVEAMGREIVTLMAEESAADAQLARDHLNAVMQDKLER